MNAYLRLKGDVPITQIEFKYKDYPKKALRYVERNVCIDREIEQVINELPVNPVPVKHVKNKSKEKLSFTKNV